MGHRGEALCISWMRFRGRNTVILIVCGFFFFGRGDELNYVDQQVKCLGAL